MADTTIVAPQTALSPQHMDLRLWFTRGDAVMLDRLEQRLGPALTARKTTAILEAAKTHAMFRARAGTGKTTGIVDGITYAPEQRILLAAFNKRIQEELATRLRNPNAEAKTVHSVGYACVRRYWERVNVARGDDRATSLVQAVTGDKVPDLIKRLIAKLLTKGREMAPHATALGELTDIALEFDCAPDEQWEAEGFDLAFVEQRALEAMELAATKKPATGIDYADMIYLPVRNKWLPRMYDLVVGDEAQDWTVTQLEILRGVCDGRLCLVGDDRQGIYGFRGADSTSLDRLKTELNAAEFGLTVTYRCPKAVVAEAARLVPDYSAAPDAPEGVIETIPALGGFLNVDKLVEAAGPDDFILSRSNAPLVRVAMALLRARKRVRVQGKDIGAGLKALVKRLATGRAKDSVPEFLKKLARWREKEMQRAVDLGREDKAEQIRDRAEVLETLTEGVTGMRELETRLDYLFDDVRNSGTIVCSSVHRAKGLEAKKVFVLRGTLYPPIPCQCGHFHPRFGGGTCQTCGCEQNAPSPARQREEQNIHYVAVTRAIETLVYVDGKAA